MSGRKIAAATVQNRTQTPFWNWLKRKFFFFRFLRSNINKLMKI